MIKLFIALLTSLNLNASSFKEQRTNKISPLADSIIALEKQKQSIPQKTISTMSVKRNKFKLFNENNSKKKNWSIRMSSYGIPKLLSGDRTKMYSGTASQVAETFIKENSEMLGIDINNLKLLTQSKFLNTEHLYYQQYYKNIPVEFSYVKIHITEKGEVTQYTAKYFPDINIKTSPNSSPEQSRLAISSELGSFYISTSTLVIYPDELNNRYYLAWRIETTGGNGNWVYYINSEDNSTLFRYDKRQYSCNLSEETNGIVNGMVYDVSPLPTGYDNGPYSWLPRISAPISDQYVFAGGLSVSTVTKSNGEYCIDYGAGDTGAKIFMTTMGPYFSVLNFTGQPYFYTNGSYQWRTTSTKLSVQSYDNDSTITYNVSPSYSINTGEALAYTGPLFDTLNVGQVDNCSNAIDNDMLFVLDSNNNAVSTFFGKNKSNIFGGLIPDQSYKIRIKSDQSLSGNFVINYSSYVVLTNPIGKGVGNVTIQTPDNGVSINVFYHLNRIRNFMMKFNSKCGGIGCADLNKRVAVMSQVYGDKATDDCYQPNTMWNTFYDLNNDSIFYGKGVLEDNTYKDFGLDGTVVRHEYGHLVINRIYPLINFGEFGAIGEAISDYFSLSSFWDEGKTLTILGNFIGTGEGATRDLSTITKRMPADWVGEVHDDGMILSGALYKIRKDSSYALGNITFGGESLNKADLYIFGALFYFPDNFENFLEALVDTCKQINNGTCSDETKIRSAFSQHGIGSQPASDIYEPNNGPEYATDISTFNTITAYIDYKGDEDYYALTLNEGVFHARLYLPETTDPIVGNGFYNAYNMFLFDSYRNYITDVSPAAIPTLCYTEYVPEHCYTRNNYVDLYYSVTKPQIYYIAVTGGVNSYYGNGPDYNAVSPYTLIYDSDLRASVNAELVLSKFDEDEIEFSVKVPKFEYLNDLTHPNWTSGSEFEFCGTNCIKVLDNNLNELSTNYITVSPSNGSSYNTYDITGNPIIKGRIKLVSYAGKTFSERYPAVGTIYLKLYAKNHMSEITGNTFNLGTSNSINLTANSNSFISYNNIINSKNATMTLKYESKEASNIKIYVYTATGQLVKKIYEGPGYGKMSFSWDGTDDSGKKLSSGIYYVKTEGAVEKVEKVAIVR